MSGEADGEDRYAEIAVSPEAFSLAGRHVVVTGAGRGLGQGIAVSAGLAGALVTAVARSADQLDETARLIRDRGGECVPHVADVADLDALPGHVAAINGRQPIDGVVHSAGIQIRKLAVDYSVEEWRRVLRVNAEAPFFLSTAIAREQRATGRPGSHVFIGSLASTIGLPNGSLYAASKTALLGVARSLSVEMAALGIRANVVGPGYFPTQLTADLLRVEENRRRILGRIPMGRMGTPADLAGTVVFLLSDASRYLTGQLINVDGGWLGA
jgi:2-dehydro-3-deoxy-D-gluconate 5-dehydrogenase